MAPNFSEIYRESLARIPAISPQELMTKLGGQKPFLLLDVREPEEFARGYIIGATNVPRSQFEQNIELTLRDRSHPIVVYCNHNIRSVFVAETLIRMGFTAIQSLTGGIEHWERQGFKLEIPLPFHPRERERYARHLSLKEVGLAGQLRLKSAKVVIIGAGGLGCPVALYLTAMGIGTITLVDFDTVDLSNLQRQVIFGSEDIGKNKATAATLHLQALNSEIAVIPIAEKFDRFNANRILEGHDLAIDGSDNFPTRYLLNDSCHRARIPFIHASIHRWEGQLAAFHPGIEENPCYRCLFPHPPPRELAPSCREEGVVGAIAGILGASQALLAIRLLLGLAPRPTGKMATFDGLSGEWVEFAMPRDPKCPVCGEHPTLVDYPDYEAFCSLEPIS